MNPVPACDLKSHYPSLTYRVKPDRKRIYVHSGPDGARKIPTAAPVVRSRGSRSNHSETAYRWPSESLMPLPVSEWNL